MKISSKEIYEVYMIPSEPRELGWSKFLEELPEMAQRLDPKTSVEMLKLHNLVTSGIELPELEWPVWEDAAVRVLVQGRRDIQHLLKKIEKLFQKGTISSVQDAVNKKVLDLIDGLVYIPRRGSLRIVGERQIKGQERETVFGAHVKEYYPKGGGIQAYAGLSENLDSMQEALCDKYDQIFRDANTMDEKLSALVFFQLWGATVLHPHWDANGRVYSAQLVLALNRMGFRVDKIPELGEISPDMAKSLFHAQSMRFLFDFMDKIGLEMLSKDEAATLSIRENLYRRYMKKLKEGILDGIEGGVDTADDSLKKYILGGAHLLKLWLSREGLIERGLYEEEAPSLIAQVRAHYGEFSGVFS